MDQEVPISELIFNFDKCLSFLQHEYVSDDISFNIVKNIKIKYFGEDINEFSDVIQKSTETYLAIIDCLYKIEKFLERLDKKDDINLSLIKKLIEKYNKIYFIKSSKKCLPESDDGIDRRTTVCFENFEGSIRRYYRVLSIEDRNKLFKKILKKDYSIDRFISNIKHKLFLLENSIQNIEDLDIQSFCISKMDVQKEKILYSSSENFESKKTAIYFLENISRIHGVIVRQQKTDILLFGDKNSLIFYDSSLECKMVYPPIEISKHTMNKYPRYIIKFFFN